MRIQLLSDGISSLPNFTSESPLVQQLCWQTGAAAAKPSIASCNSHVMLNTFGCIKNYAENNKVWCVSSMNDTSGVKGDNGFLHVEVTIVCHFCTGPSTAHMHACT